MKIWKSWRENLWYRLLSLLLAAMLWWYVTDAQNPIGERLLEVPLEVEGVAVPLVVADRPDTVQVRLQAKADVLDKLTSRDVRAMATIKEAKKGLNLVPVKAVPPQGVDVVSISPNVVDVTLDQVIQAQMPVEVELVSPLPKETGLVVLEPRLQPAQVLISGPQRILDEIKRVFVQVDLGRARDSFTTTLPVQVTAAQGRSLREWLELTPAIVEVMVPVVPETPRKSFPVEATIEGKLAPGYQIKRVVVEPDTVVLMGAYERLADLTAVKTKAVDIQGARATVFKEVELELESNLKTDLPGPVKVMVEVEPAGQ